VLWGPQNIGVAENKKKMGNEGLLRGNGNRKGLVLGRIETKASRRDGMKAKVFLMWETQKGRSSGRGREYLDRPRGQSIAFHRQCVKKQDNGGTPINSRSDEQPQE